MILSPEVYNKITAVVFTRQEPTVTTVFWARPSNPEGTGFDFFVFDNGSWQSLSQYDNVIIPEVDPYLSAFINDVGFYKVPTGGIPSTDLSEAVQTALSAASSAYQKPSSGIPATDLADGVIPDVSRKADKVSGATGGNVAGLNNNGNLTDTGIASSNVVYSSSTGSTVSPVSFDPQADTVHVTSQVLLPAAQAQARTNIAAEGKMNVVTVPSATSTLTPDIGKAYIITDDIAITLPTTTSTDLENIILYITTGTNNAVTISAPSGQTLVYLKGFGTIEDSKMYEINCQWNTVNWVLGKVELEAGT